MPHKEEIICYGFCQVVAKLQKQYKSKAIRFVWLDLNGFETKFDVSVHNSTSCKQNVKKTIQNTEAKGNLISQAKWPIQINNCWGKLSVNENQNKRDDQEISSIEIGRRKEQKRGKSNQKFTCSRAIWNHVFATIFKRFAWFICVVLTAKNTSSNWMVVGFGVTVPASIVIWLLNSFVVTSFNHGNCVGVKFRWNPSKSPLDLGALTIWKGNKKIIRLATFVLYWL